MVQARKNPTSGRYVLYVGDARGLSYYVTGVDGSVDLFCRTVREFQAKYSEDHPEHIRDVVEQFRKNLPDGWVITHKASEQLTWIQRILNRNPKSQGEITMAEKKSQPKLSAGKKPAATPSKPEKKLPSEKVGAAEPKPAKTAKPAKGEGESAVGGRKNPYAGMKIEVLSKDIAAREGSLRHAVLSEIIKCKKVDDIYGMEVTGEDGKTGTVNTAWLNFAASAGLVQYT